MHSRLQAAAREIERHYGDRLAALALFGSRVGSRWRADSDWDVLLAMAPSEPIRRALYGEWDEHLSPRIEALLANVSPHFVHLPGSIDEPSPFWLEIACAHQVVSDPTGALVACLGRVKELIDHGRYERRAAHGLPYWRRAG